MILGDDSFTVFQNLIGSLYHRIGREPSILLAERHGASSRTEPHTERVGCCELHAHEVAIETTRVEIVMIGRARATGLQQLCHGYERRVVYSICIDIFPDIVEKLEPVE